MAEKWQSKNRTITVFSIILCHFATFKVKVRCKREKYSNNNKNRNGKMADLNFLKRLLSNFSTFSNDFSIEISTFSNDFSKTEGANNGHNT